MPLQPLTFDLCSSRHDLVEKLSSISCSSRHDLVEKLSSISRSSNHSHLHCRKEFMASSGEGGEDERKVEILLQRDQTIAEVMSG